jgi:hypothetical protein
MSYLTNNILNDCGYTQGGIQRIWFANWTDLRPFLRFSGTNLNKISNIEAESIYINWLEFDLEGTICNFKEEMNVNPKLIGRIYNHSINLYFSKVEEEKRTAIDQLIKSGLLCIFKDFDDRFFLIGTDTPLKSASFVGKTDVSGGANDINIQFFSVSKSIIKEISSDYAEPQLELVGYVAVDGNSEMIGNTNDVVGFHYNDII